MRKNELREKPCRLLAAVRLRAARRKGYYSDKKCQYDDIFALSYKCY